MKFLLLTLLAIAAPAAAVDCSVGMVRLARRSMGRRIVRYIGTALTAIPDIIISCVKHPLYPVTVVFVEIPFRRISFYTFLLAQIRIQRPNRPKA